jgi:hypothetical protein
VQRQTSKTRLSFHSLVVVFHSYTTELNSTTVVETIPKTVNPFGNP